jgi:hypothetical protein
MNIISNLPAYNEEKAIANVIKDPNYVSEIIVIRQSTDNTQWLKMLEPLYYLKIIRDMVMPV